MLALKINADKGHGGGGDTIRRENNAPQSCQE